MTDTLEDIEADLAKCDRLYDRYTHPDFREYLCEIQADLMARRAEILKKNKHSPQSRHNSAG